MAHIGALKLGTLVKVKKEIQTTVQLTGEEKGGMIGLANTH